MTHPVRALFAVFLVLFAVAATAATVSVDCNAAQTINGALSGLDNQGPHTINVSGNCHESVLIFQRERVAILGAPGTTLTPPLATSRAFNINNATSVTIDGFAITGGRGVVISANSTANLSNLAIQNSGASGLTITDGSRVNASVLHISGSTRAGIALSLDSSLFLDTSTIENNGASGISVTNARLQVFGGDGTPGTESYIRNNGNNGIGASGGYVEVDDDVRIQNNGASGILAIHAMSFFMVGAGLIEGSGGNGIYVGETSHGEIGGVTVRNNGTNTASTSGRDGVHVVENSEFYLDGGVTINGNAGHGVSIDYASMLSSVGGNTISNNGGDGAFIHANGTGHWLVTDTITGNSDAAIVCDPTSLVTGDISGVNSKDVRCARVERDNGKPRPGNTKNHLIP